MFMMASMLLSLWISSAGVIAMLIPVVEAVVEAMFPKVIYDVAKIYLATIDIFNNRFI